MSANGPPSFRFHYLTDYSIPQYVAEGGNASVWRASRPHPNKPGELQAVAIKVIRDIDSVERHSSLREIFMRRLFREISLMAHFTEVEGFVHILDMYMTDVSKDVATNQTKTPRRDLYIVMPFIDRSLKDLIQLPLFKGGFSESMTRSFAKQLLMALACMEKSNCIHRDLTLANVLVGGDHPNYKIYVADFGLSRAYFDSNDDITNVDLVTLPYRPPELTLKSQELLAPLAGPKLLGNKIDIWSLGIILVECLIGRPLLYDVKDDVTLLKAIVERVDRPTELNDRVKAMLTEAGFNIVRNKCASSVVLDIADTIKSSKPAVSQECIDVIKSMLRFHPDDRKLATELLTMEWLSGSSEAPPSQSPRDNLRGVEEMSYEEMLHSIHIMCGTSIPEHCFELPYSGTQHR